MSNRIEPKGPKFMELYEPVNDRFQRFCRARTSSVEEARELVSETILETYESLESLRDEKAILYFMFRIASRLISKKYRRQKFWSALDMFTAENIESTHNPERETDAVLLHDALSKLDPKHQEAIVLHFISGMTLQEVAEIQNAGLSAVKQRISRGKEKLMKLLKTNYQIGQAVN